MPRLFFFILLMLISSGCRSEADQMAEFCLSFAQITETHTDCPEIAKQMTVFLNASHPKLKDDQICAQTTACLPCREAAKKLLQSCGHAPEMRPVLDRMHFSKSLREDLQSPPTE
jgi:hypothetical protein